MTNSSRWLLATFGLVACGGVAYLWWEDPMRELMQPPARLWEVPAQSRVQRLGLLASDVRSLPSFAKRLGLQPESLLALDTLWHARAVTSYAIFYSGETSPLAIAYSDLLGDPKSVMAFRLLASAPLPAGRIYALAGLDRLAPAEAERLRSVLLTDRSEIPFQSGCVLGAISVSEAASESGPVLSGLRRAEKMGLSPPKKAGA